MTANNQFLFSFETNLESLNGRRILAVGLLTVKIVNKIQLRLILYFELFDLENFRLGSQKLHLTSPPSLLLIRNEGNEQQEDGRGKVF